jgi:hypothetical protein
LNTLGLAAAQSECALLLAIESAGFGESHRHQRFMLEDLRGRCGGHQRGDVQGLHIAAEIQRMSLNIPQHVQRAGADVVCDVGAQQRPLQAQGCARSLELRSHRPIPVQRQ